MEIANSGVRKLEIVVFEASLTQCTTLPYLKYRRGLVKSEVWNLTVFLRRQILSSQEK